MREGPGPQARSREVDLICTGRWRSAVSILLLFSHPSQSQVGVADDQRSPATRTIFVTAVETKGATTVDRLAPPPGNPSELSKGHMFRKPGEADTSAPQKWEASSHLFSPGFVTAQRGVSFAPTVSVVNGGPARSARDRARRSSRRAQSRLASRPRSGLF